VEEHEQEAPRGYGPVTAIAGVAAGFALGAAAIAFAGGWPHIHHGAPLSPAAPQALTYQPPLNDAAPIVVHAGAADWIASWPAWVAWAAPAAFLLIATAVFTVAAAYLIDRPERKHRKTAAAEAPATQPAAGDTWFPLPDDTDSYPVRALRKALANGQVPSPARR
jgi:hypothetical protein